MPLASADPYVVVPSLLRARRQRCHEQPVRPELSTVIAVLKAIEGLELVKSKNSAPDTFAVVLIEKEKGKSQVIKKDGNPRRPSDGSTNW
ncbi:hypothetical protein BV25DRAFT_1922869 [Artomyces pyxidatus]|uniref:Uncharacterized protein n=2 Tax=Artomyces pyxidatus TaxID=48021 RepID=A0ACB8SEQ8_9AGAM|nr:hypothetical protein BV25DRAFT_1922871 [Artomyces pyxidatus]KAI0054258.1 hypothetical protein BV25DRAFT_1922869 [Artomyces pyxidatus]